jgi:hypothetical protein
MKRVTPITAALALALPAPALAFHHTGLPATACHAPAAGSPSNDNGMAKEALIAAGQTLPLPPVGTPGDGQRQGGGHCVYEWSADELADPRVLGLVRDGNPIYAWPLEERHVWRSRHMPFAARVLEHVTRPSTHLDGLVDRRP